MKKATTTGSAPKTEKKAAPAKRAAAPAAVTSAKPAEPRKTHTAVSPTAIIVKVDVGFGNLVHIRGEGPGLSWDRGVPMECASSDTWTWSTTAATRPFAFKVLINDERWSTGDDYVATVGAENAVAPTF